MVSTFAAFFEGIAREGFDMWRYQRNLTGVNEGLNVTFHLSHVGACTGRDHFSGWGLDWINVGLTYLPYLHRFYAPADARAAFLAVVDLAAHYGGHVIGIPRDNLPVLEKQDGSGPLWEPADPWEPVTAYRRNEGAERAILAFGAPAFLAGDAAGTLGRQGLPTDVHIVNGLPLTERELERLLAPYPGGVVTVEDGFIGTPQTGNAGVRGAGGVQGGRGGPARGPRGDHRSDHGPLRRTPGDLEALRHHLAGAGQCGPTAVIARGGRNEGHLCCTLHRSGVELPLRSRLGRLYGTAGLQIPNPPPSASTLPTLATGACRRDEARSSTLLRLYLKPLPYPLPKSP